MNKSAVFISYRRDDCPGYAGRLEDALEKIYGRGRVFRDIRDIAAGEDFTKVIESGLASARGTLVLIGPRWAGVHADGTRRIDDPQDFVRLEVVTALASSCRVVPVLLAGTSMPATADLPEPLRPLAALQALTLDELNWESDIKRLVASLEIPTTRRRNFIVGGIAAAALAVLAFASYGPRFAPAIDPKIETAENLLGTWQASVRYDWGDTAQEQFIFRRFAGEITGTATFLTYPRGVEAMTIKGKLLEFVTHTVESMNGADHELTHHYQAELDGDALRMRMQTTGGVMSHPPLEFEANRLSSNLH